MRVTLVCHSDNNGGAAVVTLRLLDALRAQGVDARMLVMHRATDHPYVTEAAPAWRSKAAFLAEEAYIYGHNGMDRADLFKASAGVSGLPLHRHPLVKEADVVVLAWVNQGMLSLAEIGRIEAPVAWVMHDMWCATGICHYTEGCDRYTARCGACHLVHKRGSHPTDLSTLTQQRKQRLYGVKPIRFVAVSHHLQQAAARSSLLAQQRCEVIPNPFPVSQFGTQPTLSRAELGLPAQGKLVVMGAARLDTPVKRFDLAIDALNSVEAPDVAAVLFGDLRDKSMLERLRIPYSYLGPLADWRTIAEVYAHSHAVLSSSKFENLPGTLIEGMAAGCVPVSFDIGGQADIIDHLDTGYIAHYPDTSDLARGIDWALGQEPDRDRLHLTVSHRFGAEAVAKRFIQLFEELINENK